MLLATSSMARTPAGAHCRFNRQCASRNCQGGGLPEQSAASDAEAPVGRSVQTEEPMRQQQVLRRSWRQALQVKVPAKREEIE